MRKDKGINDARAECRGTQSESSNHAEHRLQWVVRSNPICSHRRETFSTCKDHHTSLEQSQQPALGVWRGLAQRLAGKACAMQCLLIHPKIFDAPVAFCTASSHAAVQLRKARLLPIFTLCGEDHITAPERSSRHASIVQ